jgi:hypothetical protein
MSLITGLGIRQYFRQLENDQRVTKLMVTMGETIVQELDDHAFVDPEVWSVTEDKLLLKADELKADVVSMYMTQHRAQPNHFPKRSLTELQAKARLLELKSSGRRLRIVKAISDDILESESMTTPDHLSFQGRSTKLAGSVLQGSRDSEGREDAVIRCVCRGGEVEEVLCNSSKVVSQSPFLSDLFKARSASSSVGMQMVELSETEEMWNSIPTMHRVFGSDNVMRFVHYSRDPGIVESVVAAEDRLAQAKKEQGDDWSIFMRNVIEGKARHLSLLEKQSMDEEQRLRAAYSAALEEDIEALKALYDSHVETECRQLKEIQRRRLAATARFFDEERKALEETAAVIGIETAEVTELQLEVQRLRQSMELIFPPEGVPRLLMLADVLRCSDLRTACCKELARRVDSFLNDSKLGSHLIRSSTIRELLSYLTDEQLVEVMKHKEKGGLSMAQLKEEWTSRQAAFEAEANRMPMDELMRFWDELPPDSMWRTALFSVFDKRQKQSKKFGSGNSMNPVKSALRFMEKTDFGAIEVTVPYHFVGVESKIPIRIGEGIGKAYFEVKILSIPKASGSVVVGLEVADHSDSAAQRVSGSRFAWVERESNLGSNPSASSSGHFGCGLSNEGVLYVDGGVDDMKLGYSTGDVIGISVDHHSGQVLFYRNGALLPYPRNISCALKPGRSYCPALTLYSTSNVMSNSNQIAVSERIRVAVELEGGMAFLPAGHRPYLAIVPMPDE